MTGVLVAIVALFPTNEAPEVRIQGVAEPPPLGAEFAPIVRVELRGIPLGATLQSFSIRAANKRGDPTSLALVDSETEAILGTLALTVPDDGKPEYRLTKPVAIPASRRLALAARTTENWVRLVARRKLSRTVSLSLETAAGAPIGITLIASKRPKGPDYDEAAREAPERFGERLPAARVTGEPGHWTLPAGQYELDSDLVIPESVTLTLEAGVTLDIAVGRSIVAFGRLMAAGTSAEPVVFQPRGDGAFGSITFQGHWSAGSVLRGARIIRGSMSFLGKHDIMGAVDVRKSSIVVEDCSFEDVRGEDALHVAQGRLEVRRSRFVQTASDAVDFDRSVGTITDSLFVDIADDAVDLGESWVTVQGIRVDKTGGKGVTAGPRARVRVADSLFVGTGRGLSSWDGSHIVADHIAVAHSIRAGLEAAHREGEEPGTIQITHSLLWKNGDRNDGEARITALKTRDDLPVDVANYSPIRVGDSVLGPPAFEGAPPVVSEADARARVATTEPEPPSTGAGYGWWLVGALGLLALMLGADRYARLKR